MRIALLSDTVFPTPWANGHGLGRAVFNLGRELLRRGHTVTLLGATGSALDGAEIIASGDRTHAGEHELAGWVRAHAGRFDAFIDSTHSHALANAPAGMRGVAWFEDSHATRAPCGVFVSRWTRDTVGQVGEVVYNSIVLDEYPLYAGPREGLLWMAINVNHKGLGIGRIVAQLAEQPVAIYGVGTSAGPLTGAEKVAALQRAVAYLFPATEDAGPQTPLEAMACGTPCIALNRAGTREYVAHGVNGFLCDSAAEMARAVDTARTLDPVAVRQSIIDGGFTVERQADEFEALLGRVVAGEVW